MTKFQREQTRQSVLYMCRLTFKTLAILLTITYGLLYAFLHIGSAEAATLKPEVVINDTVVHLSDVFDDVPAKKDAIIGNAPELGQTVVLNARTLRRIAETYDLNWKPETASAQIIVRRSEKTITTADISALIKKDLEEKGLAGTYDISLNNVAPTIVIPGNLPATAEISQMSYTPGKDVFTAVVAAPDAAHPVKTLTVSGIIRKTIQVPVLTADAKAGDIIASSDIQWVGIPASGLINDTIIDADSLIGKTPVRIVNAGVPVRAHDIAAPQMVARGDDVLVQFEEGGLTLTAKGRAMQNGAEGDIIRVQNLSSNQSLRAEVVGDKIVRVR